MQDVPPVDHEVLAQCQAQRVIRLLLIFWLRAVVCITKESSEWNVTEKRAVGEVETATDVGFVSKQEQRQRSPTRRERLRDEPFFLHTKTILSLLVWNELSISTRPPSSPAQLFTFFLLGNCHCSSHRSS